MEIQDYIDPENVEHMKEYVYMQSHGAWSDSFLSKKDTLDIKFTNPSWKQLVDVKIADYWIEKQLGKPECERIQKED